MCGHGIGVRVTKHVARSEDCFVESFFLLPLQRSQDPNSGCQAWAASTVSHRAISPALDMNCVVLCFMLWNRVSSLYSPGYLGTHHVARCASCLSLPGTGIPSRSYHTWQICFVLKIVSAACGVMIHTWSGGRRTGTSRLAWILWGLNLETTSK